LNLLNKKAFMALKKRLEAEGYADEIRWAETLKWCTNADDFFGEYMWVVLSSGMKNQIARLIQNRIIQAWGEGKPTSSAFGHKGKVKAIDEVSNHRVYYFLQWQQANDKLEYLATIPWIGDITKFHLAKNLGMDIAKPDRHLVRIAKLYDTSCFELCRSISSITGLRVATVDLIIWRASNLRILMITWKFKCLNCNYKFSAIEPVELYEAYNKCSMCGSVEFEKGVVRNEQNTKAE